MAFKPNFFVLHLYHNPYLSGRLATCWVTRVRPKWSLIAEFRLRPIFRPRTFSTSRLKDADGVIEPKRSRLGNSTLTINGELRDFDPTGANFRRILEEQGQVYFDRTRYISVLGRFKKPILFLRPRRFGKSLTVNMLEHFHGLQYMDTHKSIYQGLDVQKDITDGRVTPGQFFILKVDFSLVNRSPNIAKAHQSLQDTIADSLWAFYKTYSTYLGKDEKELLENIAPENPARSLRRCVDLVQEVISKARDGGEERLAGIQGIYLLVDEYDTFSNDYLDPNSTTWEGTEVEKTFKNFWSTVKSLLDTTNGISRIFVTGISPLSLTDVGSGFNVAKNLSFQREMAGLCGLTRTDIEASLREICGSDHEAYQKHLSTMTKYLNGYHFCDKEEVETVYNTQTCLDFLQSVLRGERPEAEDPPNSEVSDQFLRRFAASRGAITDLEQALKRDENGNFIPLAYRTLKRNFNLADLSREVEKRRPAWLSQLLYYGGLTFYPEDPIHYLKIPNLVAANRIAEVILEKYELHESLNPALQNLEIDGNIEPVLNCYRDLMVQRDVGYSNYSASEQTHRDSFYFSFLRNAALRPRAEVQLSGTPGRCDLVLPLRKYLVVTEWKVIQIDYLDICKPRQSSGKASKKAAKTPVHLSSRESKASILSTYTLERVLDLKFGKNDKFRTGQTIKQWIEDESAPRLKNYVTSEEVKGKLKGGFLLKAHLVVVVGSRHILLWDMDRDGELAEMPSLVGVSQRTEQGAFKKPKKRRTAGSDCLSFRNGPH